jgi:hypothetical protein
VPPVRQVSNVCLKGFIVLGFKGPQTLNPTHAPACATVRQVSDVCLKGLRVEGLKGPKTLNPTHAPACATVRQVSDACLKGEYDIDVQAVLSRQGPPAPLCELPDLPSRAMGGLWRRCARATPCALPRALPRAFMAGLQGFARKGCVAGAQAAPCRRGRAFGPTPALWQASWRRQPVQRQQTPIT